jgi:hypothetical protein
VEHQVFPGTTPDKKGAIDSYRIFFAASPEMTAEIHDMVAAGDKVAIRATYRGTDEGGFIPNMPATGKPFEMEAIYVVRLNDHGQNRRALGCRRHNRNNGTARSASAPRMSGRYAERRAPAGFAVCPPPSSPSSFRLQSRQELWRWALLMPRPVIVAFAGDPIGVGRTVLGSWR